MTEVQTRERHEGMACVAGRLGGHDPCQRFGGKGGAIVPLYARHLLD